MATGPREPFYQEAVSWVGEFLPDLDPAFDRETHATVTALAQSSYQHAVLANSLRDRLDRAERTILPLQHVRSLVDSHYQDQCSSWVSGGLASRMLRSVVLELGLVDQGQPPAEQLDTNPVESRIMHARAQLELVAEQTPDNVRPDIAGVLEYLKVIHLDVQQLGAKIQQLETGRR